MKKFRIYISKSKQSDFNELLKLKSDLSKFKNIEILEFQGGNYTPDLLLSADLVIFIPPKDPVLKEHLIGYAYLDVGKGQYKEFENTSFKNSIPCVLYIDDHFYVIEDADDAAYLEDQTWQKWGILIIATNKYYQNLKDLLSEGFTEFEESVEISSNQLKKLLINYGN